MYLLPSLKTGDERRNRELTVRNYARKKLVIARANLLPPRITFTFIKPSTIIRRLAGSFPAFHFLAHII